MDHRSVSDESHDRHSSQGDDSKNWRFRRILARQLVDLVPLYSPEDVDAFIVPLALNLACDPISFVRQPSNEAVCGYAHAMLPFVFFLTLAGDIFLPCLFPSNFQKQHVALESLDSQSRSYSDWGLVKAVC